MLQSRTGPVSACEELKYGNESWRQRENDGCNNDSLLQFELMCYEQGKTRLIRGKGAPSNALIGGRKFLEPKEKQNQKLNVDYATKPRSYYQQDNLAATSQFEHSKNTGVINIPREHTLKDKNLHPNYPQNMNYQNATHQVQYQTTHVGHPSHHSQGYYLQTAKALTFANVKHNKKDHSLLDEPKKKVNPLLEKDRPEKDRSLLPEKERGGHLLDKKELKPEKRETKIDKKEVGPKAEKKEAGPSKAEKKDVLVKADRGAQKEPPNKNKGDKEGKATFRGVHQIDDFTCSEELDFKPVEKKSLVPEKKFMPEKTTSKFDFGKPKKQERVREGRELKEFEGVQKSVNAVNEGQSLLWLCQKQEEYMVDPGYLEKRHRGLLWWSRAILVDWMRHISFEFGLQRDTYHIAVAILDNYLARINNVPKSILQAIGATSLFIASKLEEFQCRESQEFAKATNHSCSVQDIHQLQLNIVKALGFRLNPPTLYSLANRLMAQWDLFLDVSPAHPGLLPRGPVFFKHLQEESYRLFRQLMQLIDCAMVDIQTAQYKPKMLVCSFMYLLLGRQMQVFTAEQIVQQFPRSSLYLLDDSNEFNDLFRGFLEHVFGFSLFEILPSVQYCATYFGLAFTYEKPVIREEEALESMGFEEYCSYQTYNSGMLKAAKQRYRGLY